MDNLATINTAPNTAPHLIRRARLRYFADNQPGIRRQKVGRGFTYLTPRNRKLTSSRDLERIERLVIPPAWTDVWICPSPRGHIQATGRDAKGRKQYLYHPRWQEVANQTKFQRLRDFGEALPTLRKQIARDLRQSGLTHSRVVAAVITLLDRTSIRIGNEEYARTNGSYGLTTLRNKHVQINGSELRFRFLGKSGKSHEISLSDRGLARLVSRCQDLPGQELFQYLDDDGHRQRVTSADVNAYLRASIGNHFTAKDFRTWRATTLVWTALRSQIDGANTAAIAKRIVNQAIRETAGLLGNTVTVCRNYYVHPEITRRFLTGELKPCTDFRIRRCANLDAGERELLAVLKTFEPKRIRTRS